MKLLGVERVILLVVPCLHGRGISLDENGFVAWLRRKAEEGHEICLHGFSHQGGQIRGGAASRFVGEVYTDHEGEFFQIEKEEAEKKVRQGLALLKEAGLAVSGFVPPAWLLSHGGREALRGAGFEYTALLNHIDLLQQRRRVYAPSLVFSCRSLWRRAASILWVQFWLRWNWCQPILRIAVHPVDFEHPAVEKALFRVARTVLKRRVPRTYADLMRS